MNFDKENAPLSSHLSPDHILVDLSASTKSHVLKRIVHELAEVNPAIDTPDLITALEAREAIVTTGIGRGVAVPHTDLATIKEPLLALGVFPEGVEFDALDGEPTYVVFLLLGTVSPPGRHLKLLARIARLSKTNGFVQELRASSSPQAVWDVISRLDTP